ncbi:hypothetical protein P5673_019822 [Acropora cervicornis]|uniref:Uncharacterized protein n=1 Tax=Acropora cervicornis TaxID=6130 RepID=A0AAD9QAP7_ACRCE|nr:hypothetical protein P5673_019822 [Acropora cervicornis]
MISLFLSRRSFMRRIFRTAELKTPRRGKYEFISAFRGQI